MMRFLVLAASALWPLIGVAADPHPPVVAPNENLLVDGVPPVPADLVEKAGRYGEYRTATLADWHPNGKEMLILTRFGDTNQVHLVKSPGGARTQLTFFPDRVEGARFEPTQGKYFVFHKGAGGAEFFQNYRYDMETGDITLLTDGKSRNSEGKFSYDGKRLAYTSTRRNGTDTDLYALEPLDPKSDRMVAELKGGGWAVQDWSPDGKQILMIEEISIAETYTWIFDADTGARKELTPRFPGERIARGEARFSKDGKGIYCTTDKGSEFRRLDYYDLATGQEKFLTPDTVDVEEFELSPDGSRIAAVLNEKGESILIAPETSRLDGNGYVGVSGSEIISRPKWSPDGSALAFNFASAGIPADVFAIQTQDLPDVHAPNHMNGLHDWKMSRWTESETGGLNPTKFVEPKLVQWPSFDGKEISGFLYAPDAAKFPGKRPVIVNIHGGPESQYRPGFLGRNNYLINELVAR